MQKSKNCNQGTLFKTCMHFSREIKEVKDACILSLQFSKITKPITTSLVKKWIRKQVYGVSDIFIIIIRKIPKLLCFLPNQANNLMFFSVTLWNFCISTRNSPPTHSPALEVFLMYSLQISLSKIESWDHKEF